MKVLVIGRVNKTAVIILRKKKYAALPTLIFACLSIFKSRVLKLYLASLILRISKRLKTIVIKNTGITMLITKIT